MDKLTEKVQKFWTDNEKLLRSLHYASVSARKFAGIISLVVEFTPMTENDPWVILSYESGKYLVLENMDGELPGYTNQRFYGSYKRLGNALNSVLLGNSLTNRKYELW